MLEDAGFNKTPLHAVLASQQFNPRLSPICAGSNHCDSSHLSDI